MVVISGLIVSYLRLLYLVLFVTLYCSQAIVFNDMVFISGVLGLNKDTNKLVEGGAAVQAKKALENIGYILEASGSSYENVIKNTILMKDLKDYGVVNEVYRQCKYL